MKLNEKRADGKPLTLDNLRAFLELCDRAGMPGSAVVRDVRTTVSGRLKSLAADSDCFEDAS